jgi:methylenetetrahydrofolate dehydrogenase (NADP+)/methenyltetrahydrofolate cyclohydrolase
MSAILLDGKKTAEEIREWVQTEVSAMIRAGCRVPRLTAIRVGDDPASEVYVRNKKNACEQVGIESEVRILPERTSQEELLHHIDSLNADESVHGILVQLPLPPQLKPEVIQERVSPLKDVDGFHPDNLGRLFSGNPRVVPCTPAGIMVLLEKYGIPLEGRRAAVIGRSNIVGKPVSILLLGKNATVTLCHSKTRDLREVVREAEIVVAAVGKPNTVTGEMVRKDSVIIDVGMNRLEGGLVGDVDFPKAKEKAAYITPVPGGVGPMTVAMLLHNTLNAAKRLQQIDP